MLALQPAAEAIGITPQQLMQELPGKSLAQVAQAHGRNPADVAAALTNRANQMIDRAVSSGWMSADQGNQAKQRIAERIQQRMDQVVPENSPLFRGREGGENPRDRSGRPPFPGGDQGSGFPNREELQELFGREGLQLFPSGDEWPGFFGREGDLNFPVPGEAPRERFQPFGPGRFATPGPRA
jgi:hypothetical protein